MLWVRGVDLPFGYVYTIAQIQENSKIAPVFSGLVGIWTRSLRCILGMQKRTECKGFSFTTWDR